MAVEFPRVDHIKSERSPLVTAHRNLNADCDLGDFELLAPFKLRVLRRRWEPKGECFYCGMMLLAPEPHKIVTTGDERRFLSTEMSQTESPHRGNLQPHTLRSG
jgi:hypothetical protein